jgi:hypothetical protein
MLFSSALQYYRLIFFFSIFISVSFSVSVFLYFIVLAIHVRSSQLKLRVRSNVSLKPEIEKDNLFDERRFDFEQ